MLSLQELRRAARVLEHQMVGARVQRVVQEDEYTVSFELYRGGDEGSGVRRVLRLSCRAQSARVGAPDAMPKAPPTPPAFAQLLRPRLAAARFEACRILNDDRQLELTFENAEGRHALLLTILGPRSNVYLLDEEGIVRGALRPLAKTRRTLKLGSPWTSPETPPPSAGEDRFADAPDDGFLEAVERHYAEQEGEREEAELERRLRQALKKARSTLERKLTLVRKDAESGAEAERHQREGELLKTVLGKVPPKASEVMATDFETGEQVRIELDPALSPAANLERLFKRYHKALKRATMAGQKLGELEGRTGELAALGEELDTLAAAEDAEALEAFAARSDVARLLGRFAPAPPAPVAKAKPRGPFAKLPARLRPRRYLSADGLEIWVGRSDEGNDHLSTRLARGNDLFFHLEASPGSHVILRTEGRKDPPPESVLEACELAVKFSKQAKATRANVHLVPIRNVKKPKGAKPGLVYVTGGRTVSLRRDPARLERVLSARIDEEG